MSESHRISPAVIVDCYQRGWGIEKIAYVFDRTVDAIRGELGLKPIGVGRSPQSWWPVARVDRGTVPNNQPGHTPYPRPRSSAAE